MPLSCTVLTMVYYLVFDSIRQWCACARLSFVICGLFDARLFVFALGDIV